MKKILFFFILTSTVTLFAQQNTSVVQKYALVIGNGNYTSFGTLNNTKNDADDMADALKGLGFNVDKLINGSRSQIENATINLRNKLSLSKNSYGFFFYAGHGVQYNGINYLIPVDANIPDSDFLRERAVSLQVILDMLNRTNNALNIVVLDACRDLPAAWTRSMDRGLAVVHPPTDSIIMYATGAGKTASDGKGRNGLFTTHLLKHLKTPGIEVNDVFRRTMSDVARESKNEQRPALYTDFADVAYLGSRPSPNTPTPQPTAANMVRINGGTFTMGGNGYMNLQRQVTVSSFYMGKYEVTQKEYQEVMRTNPSGFKGDNLPVECVSWYDAIEYCNKRSQKEGLTPAYIIDKNNKDIHNTNSEDTTKWTVTWNKSANGYRLPTEAEWEYACRAGTTTAYNTGANISDSTGWYEENSNGRTQPVGQKPANAWGLHDTHGNVWEWCWDWLWYYASGAQTNPAGEVSGTYRVFRGGSWFDLADFLVSTDRYGGSPFNGGPAHGFRVVHNAE